MKFKQSVDLLSDVNYKSFIDKLDEHTLEGEVIGAFYVG